MTKKYCETNKSLLQLSYQVILHYGKLTQKTNHYQKEATDI